MWIVCIISLTPVYLLLLPGTGKSQTQNILKTGRHHTGYKQKCHSVICDNDHMDPIPDSTAYG